MAPTVSICLITYNHASFVADALKGILEQQVDFPCELLIADDASRDDTRRVIDDILSASETKFKIRKLYAEKNSGMAQNFFGCIEKTTGKYVALCEGDDYWIDKYKLASQVAILENDNSVALCCHRCKIRDQNIPHTDELSPDLKFNYFDSLDLARNNFIITLSVMFRKQSFKTPDWVYSMPAVDYPLHLFNSKSGKIYYSPDISGVYRKHQSGAWSYKKAKEKILLSINDILIPLIDHETNLDVIRAFKKNITTSLIEFIREDSLIDENINESLFLIKKYKDYIDFEFFSEALLLLNQELLRKYNLVISSNSYKLSKKIMLVLKKLSLYLKFRKLK